MKCTTSGLISRSLPAIATVLLLASEASAQAPTLEGETLQAASNGSALSCVNGLIELAVQGTASGPIRGTFGEKGIISFDPGSSRILSVKLLFEIVDRSVKGHKSLQDGVARCDVDAKTGVTNFSAMLFLTYEASIAGVADNGEATLDLAGSIDRDGTLMALKFIQIFHSSDVVTSTLGKVTAGGNILVMDGSRGVTFGFNAQNTDKGMKGSGVVIDHTVGTMVKILDVTALAVDGTHAIILGTAEVDGVKEHYRIDVDDLGEPGTGRDTFRIVTESYRTGGSLSGGNIQIHK